MLVNGFILTAYGLLLANDVNNFTFTDTLFNSTAQILNIASSPASSASCNNGGAAPTFGVGGGLVE